MQTFICPPWPDPTQSQSQDIRGCGFVFRADPDEEGIVDCPECGIWFTPRSDPKTIIDTGRDDHAASERNRL